MRVARKELYQGRRRSVPRVRHYTLPAQQAGITWRWRDLPMFLEMARIQIDPARKTEFLAAVAQAAPLFQAAAGCRSMRIAPVVEHAAQFMLLVEWDTLADHMDGFRNSAAFQQWRALAGPFFVAPPVVEHAETGPSFF